MSEQQQQDQTHDYNANAAAAIAAMPKDEQGLPVPDETAYNDSQVIYKNDPSVRDRQNEIALYSGYVGAYAEGFAGKQAVAKEIGADLTVVARGTATNGVNIRGFGKVVAKEGGILVKYHPTVNRGGGESFYRSPANMVKDNQTRVHDSEQAHEMAIASKEMEEAAVDRKNAAKDLLNRASEAATSQEERVLLRQANIEAKSAEAWKSWADEKATAAARRYVENKASAAKIKDSLDNI
jgi:hypothetical protein